MQKEYIGVGETFNFQEIETKGEKQHVITGYVSTKSIDKFNDTITDECLDDMLVQIKSGSIKMDLEHETIHENNLNITPVARIIDAKKDDRGLWVKAILNESSPRFNEVWGSIKNGFLDAFSIAFKPLETATRYIQGKAVRILNKLKLINVGITGTPVNEDCRMDQVVYKAISEMDNEEELVPLDEISDEELEIKHKYIKRTGKPGDYTYFYRDGSSSKSPKGESEGTDKESSKDKLNKEFEKRDEDGYGTSDKDKLAGSERAISILKETGSKRIKEIEEDIKQTEKHISDIGEPKTKGEKNRKELLLIDLGQLKERKKDLEETFNKGIKRENENVRKLKVKYKDILEKKALSTQSGLTPEANNKSNSTSKEEDNKQMAEETENKPVEQTEVKEEQVAEQTENNEVQETKEVENTESNNEQNQEDTTEVEALKSELAEVKAQLVEVQKQLAKPELKALQEAQPITKLGETVTPLGLIG